MYAVIKYGGKSYKSKHSYETQAECIRWAKVFAREMGFVGYTISFAKGGYRMEAGRELVWTRRR